MSIPEGIDVEIPDIPDIPDIPEIDTGAIADAADSARLFAAEQADQGMTHIMTHNDS